MAKKQATAESDDLLGGAPEGDDLLGGAKGKGKAKANGKATPAKANGKAATGKPAGKAATGKPASKAAAPKEKKERATPVSRGEGKFYMDPEEKEALAKKIASNKKPITTKELAEKLEAPTWQVRRAINEILVPGGKGSVAKVGSSLTYTPA